MCNPADEYGKLSNVHVYIYVLPCLDPNIDVIILRSVAACNGILERKIIVCYKHTCKISDTLF